MNSNLKEAKVNSNLIDKSIIALQHNGLVYFLIRVLIFIERKLYCAVNGRRRNTAMNKRYEDFKNRNKVKNGRYQVDGMFGFQMNVLAHDLGISKELIAFGKREESATNYLAERINGKMTIIEVGANIGYYVLLEASKIESGSHIYAFEPAPENFDVLKENIKINNLSNLVNAYQMGVSNYDGEACLTIENYANWHHIDNYNTNTCLTGSKKLTVSVVSLDRFCEQHKIDEVDLIRADIEGHEYAMIEGAKNTLNKMSKCILFIELHTNLLQQLGKNPIDLLDIIEGCGFRCSLITGHQNRVKKDVKWNFLKKNLDAVLGYYGYHIIFEKE